MTLAKAPVNSSRPFRMKAGISRVEDLANGVEALSHAAVGAKTVYYCDGNAGIDTNSGVGGWENSVKTLTVALALSQADIALNKYGWAARNVIFCRGDAFDEDLVLLAQKTDVIGLGSWNANPQCGLIGNHVPVGTTCSYGTRFFNFRFRGNAAGGDIWTLDDDTNYMQFVNCVFDSSSTTAATAGLVATASPYLQVLGCEFSGHFSDAALEIGAGDASGLRIVGNWIEGDNNGIEINASTTDGADGSERHLLIADNYVSTALICIDDNSDLCRIVNNVMVSESAKGSSAAGIVDGNVYLSAGNKITGSDLANADWPALGTI